MKRKTLYNPYLIIVFLFITQLNFSNTVLVFVDYTRNLDYFVDGNKYKLKNDLKDLIKEYNLNSLDRLILVEIKKYNKDKIRGKIIVIGEGKEFKKRFRSKEKLKEFLNQNTTNKVDFLLLSHSVSSERLDAFLSFSGSKYDLILASACKMASIEKLKVMSKYSSFAIASPVNIHLAHLDISGLSNNLKGTTLEKGKRILDKSFSRLLKFTRSNLVLNLYKLDAQLLNKDICVTNNFDKLILHQKIKLSLFEKKKKSINLFKILDCED